MVEAEQDVSFCRTGDYWTVHFAGRVVHLHDSKGLADLSQLLARPGQGLHVLHLLDEHEPSGTSTHALSASLQDGLRVAVAGGWDEPLDARAFTAYRARYADLTTELEEARNRHDAGHEQRLGLELAQLVHELQQRRHPTCAATERARKAVYNRVRAAIRRISKHDRELGWHLSVTIKTGVVCRYQPEYARYARAC